MNDVDDLQIENCQLLSHMAHNWPELRTYNFIFPFSKTA